MGAAAAQTNSVPLAATTATNPVSDGAGGVRNVTFYYQGTTQLAPGSNLAQLGNPAIVVTTPKANEQAAIAAIHSTGAKAYIYLQAYWAPNDRVFEGIDLSKHMDWAFCRSGSTPLLGRTLQYSGHAEPWYFFDTNERPVRDAFTTILSGLKSQGWDGVFFDRGMVSMLNGTSADGQPVWDKTSTCTGQPYAPGATFADSFVNLLGLAHQVGLQAMVNYGFSPFDTVVPMRPDPRDPSCQAGVWTRCRFLSDVWGKVDLVLTEGNTALRDARWSQTFASNRRSEQSPTHGQRNVLLITTSTLGGVANETRPNIFYEWSRIKLFNLAVAVNTGDGGCVNQPIGVCNRYGLYPSLVNVRFGKPTFTDPRSFGCITDAIHCLWTRRYAYGMNLLNVSSVARKNVTVNVTGTACRYVYDLFARAPLAQNRCVHQVSVTVPAWSGRPLTFSTKPHA